MKIYIPNNSNTTIGGGFTFQRNFIKGIKGKAEFVNNWKECDIVFVFGITTMDKKEVHGAVKAGKKLVLRVDNIPRRSRNKRQSPAERLREFGLLADQVIYQSKWAEGYAGYFAGKGIVIMNGVDTEIFNGIGRQSDGLTYLYVNYNDNPNKRFDEALYWFDMHWRKDNDSHLIVAGNAPRIYLDHPEYNWDLPTDGEVEYVGVQNTPEEMARLYKKCDMLLYPSFAEACPNVVAEAMACGCFPIHLNDLGGALEIKYKHYKEPYTIEQMADEYLKVFEELLAG